MIMQILQKRWTRYSGWIIARLNAVLIRYLQPMCKSAFLGIVAPYALSLIGFQLVHRLLIGIWPYSSARGTIAIAAVDDVPALKEPELCLYESVRGSSMKAQRLVVATLLLALTAPPIVGGCSSHRETTTTVERTPATGSDSGSTTTTTTTTDDEPDSVLGATAHAIGTIILFPFRLIGDALSLLV